jgi:hypothetical protein
VYQQFGNVQVRKQLGRHWLIVGWHRTRQGAALYHNAICKTCMQPACAFCACILAVWDRMRAEVP